MNIVLRELALLIFSVVCLFSRTKHLHRALHRGTCDGPTGDGGGDLENYQKKKRQRTLTHSSPTTFPLFFRHGYCCCCSYFFPILRHSSFFSLLHLILQIQPCQNFNPPQTSHSSPYNRHENVFVSHGFHVQPTSY